MPIGLASDFKIYDDQFYAGMIDVLQQETDAFNGSSANAIRLVQTMRAGDFAKEAFFEEIQNVVTRRDTGSTAASDPNKLTSDEIISVKLARKFHIENTLDSLRKIASDQQEFSMLVGEAVGKSKAADYVNTALLSLRTALTKTSDVYLDKTAESGGAELMQYKYLVEMLATFGDKANNIVAWVMHSKPFFDLVGESLTVVTDRVAGATIYEGVTGTMGKPVVVVDSPDLIDATGGGATPATPSYFSFGLTANGAVVEESEEMELLDEVVGGGENLVARIQGEHSFNMGVKGFSYTSATKNPEDATLGASANWTFKKNDYKLGAGVVLETL